MARLTFADFSTKRHQRFLAKMAKRFITKTITVTEQDILNGEPGVSSRCPVALAFKRMFPNAVQISVSRVGAFVWQPNGMRENWQLVGQDMMGWQDSPLAKYVADVDRDKHVDPITLEFSLVSSLPERYEPLEFTNKVIEIAATDEHLLD
jgi:hypothetical protein